MGSTTVETPSSDPTLSQDPEPHAPDGVHGLHDKAGLMRWRPLAAIYRPGADVTSLHASPHAPDSLHGLDDGGADAVAPLGGDPIPYPTLSLNPKPHAPDGVHGLHDSGADAVAPLGGDPQAQRDAGQHARQVQQLVGDGVRAVRRQHRQRDLRMSSREWAVPSVIGGRPVEMVCSAMPPPEPCSPSESSVDVLRRPSSGCSQRAAVATHKDLCECIDVRLLWNCAATAAAEHAELMLTVGLCNP